MHSEERNLRKTISRKLVFFMTFLILSGLTAFPLETELGWLIQHDNKLPRGLQLWFDTVYGALKFTNEKYPFLSYGTDWLAFAHIVIAILFIGPLKHPVRNIWCIEFGLIACVLVIPLALFAGTARQIPIFWQLFDCAFGVIAFLLLLSCYANIKKLERIVTLHNGKHQHHRHKHTSGNTSV